MSKWPGFPVVYEVNTWVWLHDLSREAGRPITLANVPQAELDRLAAYGFDALWLMGVWQRSPNGCKVARAHPGLQMEYRRALPDYTSADVVGSPYAVQNYRTDRALGGDEELAALRERLRLLGLRVILDFVPNHVANDHAWVTEHPERIVQGSESDLLRNPVNYFRDGKGRVFAHGKDPYFPGWTDTAQLDYRRRQTREAMTDVLLRIAKRCDGLRCDMAMLITREVFLRTWGGDFDPLQAEFWPAAIARVKESQPDFLMIAEVYWDMEFELQQMGFDYTYDKRLYEYLQGDRATALGTHLRADGQYQNRLVRFIENHDERRAVEVFGSHRSRAVATLALGLPGMRLFHDGQLEGRRLKLPVQLGRRHPEPVDPGAKHFYRRLLTALSDPVFHDGHWRLLEPKAAWDGNQSHHNFVAYHWVLDKERRVIVVNLSAHPAQCFLPLGLSDLGEQTWHLCDLLNDAEYIREGDDLGQRGLYLDVPAHGYHLFNVEPYCGTPAEKPLPGVTRQADAGGLAERMNA